MRQSSLDSVPLRTASNPIRIGLRTPSQRIDLLLAAALLAVPALAQFETGEVLGTIRDQNNSLLPRATVTLLSQDTGTSVNTTTDDGGNFVFPRVKLGRYTLSAEAAGFSRAVATDIRIDINAKQRVDLALRVGQVNETIEVTGAAAVIETDSSEKGHVINGQQVDELPLNGRAYAELALLAPNVHVSPAAVMFAANGTPRESSFNVNGMRSTYNNFVLDGVDNNAYSPSNQGFSSQVVQPSPDAIAEFKVVTSNFSAEYGRVGGGVVNAALRSGTNRFHGTGYDFFRNTVLNALGYSFTSAAVDKPTLQRNQYGLSIGGPFIKNKLFFFADYEGYRQLQRYRSTVSLPTMNDRQGILPNAVTNPLTGQKYAANTPIPIAQINPFAADVLNALPVPNSPGRGSNFTNLLLVRDYSDKYDAKLNYTINAAMTSFLRFSQRKEVLYNQPNIDGLAGGAGNGFVNVMQQQAATGYTWTLTPTSLLEARFGFSHVLAGKNPPNIGGPSPSSAFPFAGLPKSSDIAGGLNTQSISSFTALGRQATNPQFQNPESFNPKVNYTWIKGRSSLKLGAEYIAIRTEVRDVNPLYGAETYSGQFSKPASNSPSDSATYNLADFMFGLPATINLGNDFVSNLRQHVTSLYVQDDFHVTSKLTLNLGLRWEFATPVLERDNNWTNFDPGANKMIKATGGSLFNRALVYPDYKDYGPRLGMAYRFAPKMVMRGGYGISYSFFNRMGSAQEGINSPQAVFGVITQSIPVGGPVPASFLVASKGFTTGIADPANFDPLTANVEYVEPHTRWAYVQSWFYSIQREIAKDTVLEVSYNGNHSLRLPILGDYNQAYPNAPGQTLGVQARRPIKTFGPITWLTPQGDNDYNALSSRFEHRMGWGLYFVNSFTWSKALGTSEQALETFAGGSASTQQDIRNLSASRGPTTFDVTLMNTASIVYQLPFGKGRAVGGKMNGVLDQIFGGWEMNSIVSMHSGTALDVSYTPTTANDNSGLASDYRGATTLRPNVSGAPISQSKGDMVEHYFAGYVFTTPPASAPYGNLGRDIFRAPGRSQWDLGMHKSFPIHEAIKLQFRSEFFNITNHTNFGRPGATSTATSFGQIRTTYPPRQIQFALKLVF